MSLSLRSQLRTANPYFAWAVEYILDVADHWGGEYSITSVNRTAAEQHALRESRTSIAAPAGCSQHQYGMAADVVFSNTAWQDWYLASARNFGLTTVLGDSVHVQMVPGARFREWAELQGLCPDPTYSLPSHGYYHCLDDARDEIDRGRCWQDFVSFGMWRLL